MHRDLCRYVPQCNLMCSALHLAWNSPHCTIITPKQRHLKSPWAPRIVSGQKESPHLPHLPVSGQPRLQCVCWECKSLDPPEVYFNVILRKCTKTISRRFLDAMQTSASDSRKRPIPFFPMWAKFSSRRGYFWRS